MERIEILKIILEQLDSIYVLDDEIFKNVCSDLNASSDEQLEEILKQLLEFRNGQVQNVFAFKRKIDQERINLKEEEERKNVDIPLDF